MMPNGLVFDIRRYSVHDGPGIRTTVFLKGCPLRCIWCHNPEGLLPEPQTMMRTRTTNGKKMICEEMAGQWYTPEEVMQEVREDLLFFEESQGGVTFSGGEPLMQPEFLRETLMLCREQGIHATIDTAGITDRQTFLDLITHADLLLYDIKCINNKSHVRYTGMGNEQILANLEALEKARAKNNHKPEVIIRIPYIPGFNNTVSEITAISRFIISLNFPVTQVELLPYHKLGRQKYEALGLTVPHQMKPSGLSVTIEETRDLFKQHGIAVKINT